MAETPSRTSTVDTSSEYWCYSCNKRVSVETQAGQDDVVCRECKDGFVESILWSPPSPITTPDPFAIDESSTSALGSQFLQMLRVFAQAAREDDGPSTPPPPPPAQDSQSEDDFLRIELDGWGNEEQNDENENENAEEEEEGEGGDDVDEEEEDHRRIRRNMFLTRMRDIATRTRGGRNRILDWAEILMGLEDNSLELRFELPEQDRYIGNREDYLDAAGFEALLQNLAESDGAAKRGAPPAAKSAVEGLKVMKVKREEDGVACAICKDGVRVGEEKMELPCGHGYHGECIVTWLGSRNSCPVCRFELPTDDADYEEEKRKRDGSVAGGSGSSGVVGDSEVS